MKALHRILVTGTICGIAILTAAASGAFACTAQVGVLPLTPQSGYVAPGGELSLRIQNFFDPEKSPGVSEVSVILEGWGTKMTIGTGPGPGFVMERWKVPPNLIPERTYALTGVQTLADGASFTLPAGIFYVSNGRVNTGATTPTTTSTNTTTPPTTVSPDARSDAPPASLPGVLDNTPSKGAGQLAPTFVDPPVPAAPRAVSVFDPGSSGSSAVQREGVNGEPPPPEGRSAPVIAGQHQLPADGLWSGLDSGPPPSLLDAALPEARDGGSSGGLLIAAAAGVLALAALAVGLSRRRLALARR